MLLCFLDIIVVEEGEPVAFCLKESPVRLLAANDESISIESNGSGCSDAHGCFLGSDSALGALWRHGAVV